MMSTPIKSKNTFVDHSIGIKQKLAMLWTSFMMLFIYVDVFHLYMPGKINDIMKGKVYLFEITQGFLLAAILSMAIPTLMIVLSVVLPAKINRITNLIVAFIYIPYMLFNLAGEAWIHMVFAAVLEVCLLGSIIYYACRWPRNNYSNH